MMGVAVAVVLILGLGMVPDASGLDTRSVAKPDSPTNSSHSKVNGVHPRNSGHSDFNNDGFADLAVGVTFEDVGSISSAGGVNVLYGAAIGLTGAGSQLFTQNTAGVGGVAEEGELFGYTLTVGDFNGDGFADLAIGNPYENIGSMFTAGTVNVLYGTATGLTGSGSQLFTQDSPGIRGRAAQDEFFGGSLSAGDFDHDGFADLAIGVHGENSSLFHAGAVNVLYGGARGLTGASSQFLTQDTPGVGSTAEASDAFGTAVTAGDFDHDGFADLAIGAPGESSSIFAVGAVNLLYGGASGLTGAGSQFFTQNSPGIGSSSEGSDWFGSVLAAGDLDGDGFADLAVGVPSESIGSVVDAGMVQLLYGAAAGLTGSGSQTFSQNSAGVSSVAEKRDGFGDRLTTGDFDRDGFGDLAVGVPGEDSSLIDVGAVHVFYGTRTGVNGPGSQFFTQNSPGVPSTAEQHDLFGDALAAGDFDADGFADLTVGASGEGIDHIEVAGALHVLHGTRTGVTGSGSQYLTQNSPGIAGTAGPSDRFGAPLAAAD